MIWRLKDHLCLPIVFELQCCPCIHSCPDSRNLSNRKSRSVLRNFIVKPKIVITLLISVLLLLAGYWVFVNRTTLFNLPPSNQSGASKNEASKSDAPKSDAPKSDAPKAAPIENSLDSTGRARKSYEILNEINNGAPSS